MLNVSVGEQQTWTLCDPRGSLYVTICEALMLWEWEQALWTDEELSQKPHSILCYVTLWCAARGCWCSCDSAKEKDLLQCDRLSVPR